jgi:hypothetical protein
MVSELLAQEVLMAIRTFVIFLRALEVMSTCVFNPMKVVALFAIHDSLWTLEEMCLTILKIHEHCITAIWAEQYRLLKALGRMMLQ